MPRSYNDSAMTTISIVGKPKVSDVLAINVYAESFPFKEFKSVFQCSGEQFRRYNISLPNASLQRNRPRALLLYSDRHGGVFVQALQHLDIPIVNTAPLERL